MTMATTLLSHRSSGLPNGWYVEHKPSACQTHIILKYLPCTMTRVRIVGPFNRDPAYVQEHNLNDDSHRVYAAPKIYHKLYHQVLPQCSVSQNNIALNFYFMHNR
jgi:hypothetical protein